MYTVHIHTLSQHESEWEKNTYLWRKTRFPVSRKNLLPQFSLGRASHMVHYIHNYSWKTPEVKHLWSSIMKTSILLSSYGDELSIANNFLEIIAARKQKRSPVIAASHDNVSKNGSSSIYWWWSAVWRETVYLWPILPLSNGKPSSRP